MEATRARFVSLLEWIVAAVVVAAVVMLASVVVHEVRTVSAVVPVVAGQTLPDPPVPAGIPARAVSVPVLLLPDGKTVRVGQGLDDIAVRLSGTDTRPQLVERGPNGNRFTRFYEYRDTRFVLVFEPFERNAEPRIAAIYLP